jgi:hypothetical protein
METPSLPRAAFAETHAGRATILLAFAGIAVFTTAALIAEGRRWWCACSAPSLWAGSIWSSHNSQHLLDPYSFTHVLHGVVFCLIASLMLSRTPFAWRLWWGTLAEAVWEVAENSAFVIERYRSVTISLGYEGDSIVNALADVACCLLGFALAHRIGARRSIIVFALTEMALLLTIRDNLTLNVLMLVWPVEGVKTWQMGG